MTPTDHGSELADCSRPHQPTIGCILVLVRRIPYTRSGDHRETIGHPNPEDELLEPLLGDSGPAASPILPIDHSDYTWSTQDPERPQFDCLTRSDKPLTELTVPSRPVDFRPETQASCVPLARYWLVKVLGTSDRWSQPAQIICSVSGPRQSAAPDAASPLPALCWIGPRSGADPKQPEEDSDIEHQQRGRCDATYCGSTDQPGERSEPDAEPSRASPRAVGDLRNVRGV